MVSTRIVFIEFCAGLLLLVVGFILWWWSKQMFWILIYPPPLVKQLFEILPLMFWSLGFLLIFDSIRRKIMKLP
jgi:hypothetical protein